MSSIQELHVIQLTHRLIEDWIMIIIDLCVKPILSWSATSFSPGNDSYQIPCVIQKTNRWTSRISFSRISNDFLTESSTKRIVWHFKGRRINTCCLWFNWKSIFLQYTRKRFSWRIQVQSGHMIHSLIASKEVLFNDIYILSIEVYELNVISQTSQEIKIVIWLRTDISSLLFIFFL